MSSDQSEVRIAVTGTGGGGIGRQVIRALRLGSLKYHIVALNWDAYSTGFPEADESYVVPPASSPSYSEKLLQVCKKTSSKFVVAIVTFFWLYLVFNRL